MENFILRLFLQLFLIGISQGTFCSQYESDADILRNIPFLYRKDPIPDNQHQALTFFHTDRSGAIVIIKIVNEAEIPPSFACFRSLKMLIIRRTPFEFTSIPKTLVDLHVYDTPIPHGSTSGIGRFLGLRSLTLSNTGLKNLTDDIAYLQNLRTLILENNELTSIPASIVNIPSLHYLSLSGNKDFDSIEMIGYASQVKELKINYCSFTKLPINLKNLQYLEMQRNKLKNLNYIHLLGSENHGKKIFDFSYNQIDWISEDVGKLSGAILLKLLNNPIDGGLPQFLETLQSNLTIYLNTKFSYCKNNEYKIIGKTVIYCY